MKLFIIVFCFIIFVFLLYRYAYLRYKKTDAFHAGIKGNVEDEREEFISKYGINHKYYDFVIKTILEDIPYIDNIKEISPYDRFGVEIRIVDEIFGESDFVYLLEDLDLTTEGLEGKDHITVGDLMIQYQKKHEKENRVSHRK